MNTTFSPFANLAGGRRFSVAAAGVVKVVFMALLLPVMLPAQVVPSYFTGFEPEEGYLTGDLHGQDGWQVRQGEARVVRGTVVSGVQSLVIPAGFPPGVVVRDFSRFERSEVVYLDFFLKGGANVSPIIGLGDVEVGAFELAVVETSPGLAAVYAFNGMTGEWERASGDLIALDGESGMMEFVRLTVRFDYTFGIWDLFVDGELVGVDLLIGGEQRFSRFVLRGHPERNVFLDDFYAGVADPLGDAGPEEGIFAERTRDEFGFGESEGYGGIFRADTSRDGLFDEEALALGLDPSLPSNVYAVELPFFEDFEWWPEGDIHARGGWRSAGFGRADVETGAAYRGERGLRLSGGETAVAVEIVEETETPPVVWTDFFVRPARHLRSEPPEIGEETVVGLYFNRQREAVAWDGVRREWVTVPIPPVSPLSRLPDSMYSEFLVSEAPPSRDRIEPWVRVTIRQDFENGTWNLWLNSVKVLEGLGFASDQYGRFQLSGPSRTSDVDNVYIGEAEPPGLDDDGDGLSNEAEIALGLDPNRPDTSGDGMWDGDKVFWGFDPLASDDFVRPDDAPAAAGDDLMSSLRLQSRGAGDRPLRPAPGVRPVGVDELYVGADDGKSIWLSGFLTGEPGVVPDASLPGGPRTALIAVNHAGYLVGYDGAAERWMNSRRRVERGEAVRVDVHLDYETGRWSLCVDGVLRLRDLGFRDPGVRTLSRLGLDGGRGSLLDDIVVSEHEPEGLDFSGDGLTNEEKRALGLDVYATDTSGDGVPDWWALKYGLDPLDSGLGGSDLHGYGLSVLEEYRLGTDPHLADTDGDGWSDFDEALAGTGVLDAGDYPQAYGLDGWHLEQVGGTRASGPHAYVVGEEYRILGSGRGVAGDRDGFTFAYRELTGNFEIVAKVRAPETLDFSAATQRGLPAQNGLMARASLSEGASYSAVFSGKSSYWSRFRRQQGEGALDFAHGTGGSEAYRYVRLRRTGHRFRHYLSGDGENWVLVSEDSVVMPATVPVGMFVSSHSEDFHVRGRVSDLEIVQLDDEADWFYEDIDGQPSFDSFAWMGEWDGIGYHDSAALALRSPSLEELREVGVETNVRVEIPGAEASDWVGRWFGADEGIVCMDRRGWIGFDIEVPRGDVYLVEIRGGEARRSIETASSFDLKLYLDDEYLGTRVLEGAYGDSGSVYAFTPWLPEGTYRLRVLWDGARAGTNLRMDSIALHGVEGPDSNGNGIKDWVEDRLARQSGTDRLHYANQEPGTTNREPILTHVSPLPIEGRGRYPSMMRIGREVFPADSPHLPPGGQGSALAADVSVLPPDSHLLPHDPADWNAYLETFLGPIRLPAKPGPGYRYHADVPLAPLADNAVTVSWQNGVAEDRLLARWVPYDILAGGEMTVRKGDSLLITALGVGASADDSQSSITLTIRDESAMPESTRRQSHFETTPDSPLVYTFTEPGEYLIEGTYRAGDGFESSGTLRVNVHGFTFPERPLALVNRHRDWNSHDVGQYTGVYEADPRLQFENLGEQGSPRLRFRSEDNDPRTIVSRLGENGPVLDSVGVEGIRLLSSWETNVRVLGALPDGSRLVEMTTILSPLPEDIEVHLRIFVGGVVFDDGTIERVLTPEDFDELGQTTVRFIMPAWAITSSCHRTYVYQNGELVGVR